MRDGENLKWNRTQRSYAVLLLGYLAILPIAGTTALRNLMLAGLLVLMLVFAVRRSLEPAYPVAGFLSRPYLPLWSWFAFLCLFPLWALQPDVAWINLKSQWGASIAAWVAGLGAIWILGRRGPGLGALAAASGALVALHLLLTLMAWAGLFGGPLPSDLPASTMWRSTLEAIGAGSTRPWSWQNFPWGFRGFDPMHGNLGYTATQAVIVLLAVLLLGLQKNHRRTVIWSALGVALCFFSVAVAHSRGSVLYQLLMLVLALVVYYFKLRRGVSLAPKGQPGVARLLTPILALVLLVAVGITLAQALRSDGRWSSMLDKVRAAFLVQDPVHFMCEGLTPETRMLLQERFQDKGPQYVEELIAGLGGDGGRIMLMRVGWQFALDQVRGLDGSRDSYRKMMEARCGHKPAMEFFHAHQSWMDIVMSLGWMGGGLWAFLLLYLAWTGWRALDHEQSRPWALALLLLAVFWFLRGLADSVYREHNLQMQALLLAYLFGRLQLEGKNPARP